MLKLPAILGSVLVSIFFWFGLTFPAIANTSLVISPMPKFLPIALFSFAGQRPDDLGIEAGKFATCPTTPNCVSSQSTDAEHHIEPLAYASTPAQAWTDLKMVLQGLERTKIVTEQPNYLYVEFTSKLMGFVDDVEFFLDRDQQSIAVRSASRLGESDLGANRQRIETIRTKLQEFKLGVN